MSYIIKVNETQYIGPFASKEPAEKEAGERFPGQPWTVIEIEPQLDSRATEDERDRATELYGSNEIEIDDDALSSRGDCGVWVQGWLWLPDEDEDDEDDEDDEEEEEKEEDKDEDIDDEDDVDARMTKTAFIRENKVEIDAVIRAQGYVEPLSNKERWDWVMNVEPFYNLAIRSGVNV